MGNTFVLLTTLQPNKYFIACLAVADLLVGMFAGPVNLYSISVNWKPQFETSSLHLCRFFVWIDTLALAASIYTVTFISFDRYLKISKPLQYRSRMTTSKSVKIVFTIWFISTTFATYAPTPDSGSVTVLAGHNRRFSSEIDERRRFYTLVSASLFFVPAIVIMVLYALIFTVAHKRHKMFRNGQPG